MSICVFTDNKCAATRCVCTNIILAQFSDYDVFVWISILFNLKNVTTKGDISFKSSNTNKCPKLIVVENQYIYNLKTNTNCLKNKKDTYIILTYNTHTVIGTYYIIYNLLGVPK